MTNYAVTEYKPLPENKEDREKLLKDVPRWVIQQSIEDGYLEKIVCFRRIKKIAERKAEKLSIKNPNSFYQIESYS